jgi:FlaG/FlaF family flagellin (archaellin)
MHYLKRMTRKNGDDAISPVVGVMLMLVVTIIIAAVVSGFAGGLMGNKNTAPSVSLDVTIKNSGTFANSFFEAKVLSTSQMVSTKDLKLVTSWGKNGNLVVTNVTPGLVNQTYWLWGSGSKSSIIQGAPWGFGPGVDAMNAGVPNNAEQQFGNYTLTGGTLMEAMPAGQSGGYIDPNSPANFGYGVETPFTYTDDYATTGSTHTDGMQAVLGKGWEILRTGDTVNVKLIYTPSGNTIFEKNVVVS